MSNQSKNINKIALGVSVIGITLIILGMFFSAGLAETKMRYWGAYLLSAGIGVVMVYYIGTFLYFITAKNTSAVSTLITFYLGISILMIVGGLTAAFFKIPLGMTTFLAGVGMFALFWVGVFLFFVFKKE